MSSTFKLGSRVVNASSDKRQVQFPEIPYKKSEINCSSDSEIFFGARDQARSMRLCNLVDKSTAQYSPRWNKPQWPEKLLATAARGGHEPLCAVCALGSRLCDSSQCQKHKRGTKFLLSLQKIHDCFYFLSRVRHHGVFESPPDEHVDAHDSVTHRFRRL